MTDEAWIRLGFSLLVFAVMATWELIAPRRVQVLGRSLRWPGNLGLAIANVVLVRFATPLTVVGVAIAAESNRCGVLHNIEVAPVAAMVVGLLALDLLIYGQHVVFHRMPWLWRLHRVHHADLEFDVTTGLRFHPGEAVISLAIKMMGVLVIGVSPLVVVVFEVVLNATSLFNHGNIRLPPALDRVLRMLVVTPDMHRVHHSRRNDEMNTNFGFNLPWWDRLFGTYRAQPAAGHQGMALGLEQFRESVELGFVRMLLQPLRPESRVHGDTR